MAGNGGWRFTAVVSQEQARALFSRTLSEAQVRLHGQAAASLAVRRAVLVPDRRERLPTPTLGWRDGGEVAVRPDDPQGTQAVEPYFEMQALIEPAAGAAVLAGMTGIVRVPLPPRPLAEQAWLSLQQLVQKRYRL